MLSNITTENNESNRNDIDTESSIPTRMARDSNESIKLQMTMNEKHYKEDNEKDIGHNILLNKTDDNYHGKKNLGEMIVNE